MGSEIVRNDDGNASSKLRTSDSSAYLLAEYISSASLSHAAIEPAITPIQQTKTIDFAVLPRCFDQTLPVSPSSRPDPCESWVKGHMHLILEIKISMWQQSEYGVQVGGKLIPEISLNQIMNG